MYISFKLNLKHPFKTVIWIWCSLFSLTYYYGKIYQSLLNILARHDEDGYLLCVCVC